MLPILEICNNNQEYRSYELKERLAEWFSLTEEDSTQLLQSGRQTVLYNRTTWATFHLRNAGLLKREDHTYSITPDGKNILSKNLPSIDLKFLWTIPKYRKWKEAIDQNKSKKNEDSDTETPTEMIEVGYQSIRRSIEQELLEKIMDNPPDFFEQLVVMLMEKMGYGNMSKVTGKPRDGGIDGVIFEDKLGLNAIYLQAKRWKSTVPIDAVKSFVGTELMQKSKKGVMITTSNFPKTVDSYIKQISVKIVLIDGPKLVEYMYDYNLGVVDENSYAIKRLDESFFE